MVTLAAFALVPLLGGVLQSRLGVPGLGLTEVFCVLVPALAAVLWSRVAAKDALALRWPSPPAIAGTLLAGLGAFYLVAGGVETLLDKLAPMSPEARDQMRLFIVPATGPRPLLTDLLLLALVPAICEETLFRGVLLSSLAKINRGGALLVTSLAFGAFHYSLYKFVPTALLGAVLGLLALRTRSLISPILAHTLNNTLVVLLVRRGLDDPPGVSSALSALWLLAAAALVAVGMLLVSRPPREPAN